MSEITYGNSWGQWYIPTGSGSYSNATMLDSNRPRRERVTQVDCFQEIGAFVIVAIHCFLNRQPNINQWEIVHEAL